MKTILFLSLALISTSIYACESYEMQFIGVVRNVQANCTYQIETHQYWENVQCPLSPGELDSTILTDLTCKLQNGDKISGIAVRINDLISIE